MTPSIADMRNIGISAHIDSGKTTLTERILFYTDRIHTIGEVRGKDGRGATMDSMELERERGITIQSAATYIEWDGIHINIIDTPGHVDFTVEVERALRVLDGAIMVLCAVSGVQSQSITVDRQMRRYNVPRIAFVNKCDRTGADPFRVCDKLREKLRLNAVMFQIPIGLEKNHQGVIDLVTMEAIYFDGDNGEIVRREEIPENLMEVAEERREMLLDAVSHYCDELLEAMLEDRVTEELIHEATRKGVTTLELCPVYCGSAFKNKGVQPLMDSVNRYLPSPVDVENFAFNPDNEEEQFLVTNDPDDPLLSYAFKLEDGPYGQLTYVRIYQGRLVRGDFVYNARTGMKVKISRIVRMHADNMDEINSAQAGDIVALFGIDCASGDTFRCKNTNLILASMHVPEPVIHLAVKPIDRKSSDNMAKALQRFTKEDPTFRVAFDPASHETVISGMGELHLEVYIERMKREFRAEVMTGPPQVAFHERISHPIEFDFTHKKQTGGSGQYARIIGTMGPHPEGIFHFENRIRGGNVPREYVSSVKKGFKQCMEKGLLIGAPVDGLEVVLLDGGHHAVDSSDMAFQTAARNCFREYYNNGKPEVLEPLMMVSLEGPSEFQGNMVGTLLKRRGILKGTLDEEGYVRIDAEVPLAEMFGYATTLRSATQGKAEFTMEFNRYAPAPRGVQEDLIASYRNELELKS